MKRRKKEKSTKIVSMILGLTLGVGTALCVLPYVMPRFSHLSLLPFEAVMLSIYALATLVSYVLMVVLHEGGHLIAGLVSGYQFVSFRVFSLMLVKLEGKLHIKQFKLVGTGGQCLMKPPVWTEQGIPVRLYNWGGVIINAVVVLLLLPAVFLTPGASLPGMLARLNAMLNLYALLANGIPLNGNDGDNALSLVNDLTAQRSFWAQMMAHALLTEGVAPAEMPEDLYALPEDADLSNPLNATNAANAAEMHLIHRRFTEGRAAVEALLAREDAALNPVHRFLLENDVIWLETMGENRADVIQPLLTKQHRQYEKAMKNYPSVLRIQYTRALAEHDADKASKARAQLDQVRKTYPYEKELEDEYALMEMADETFANS